MMKKISRLLISAVFAIPVIFSGVAAQVAELELKLDANAATSPLPDIYKPGIDLSGRGFHRINLWPQTLATAEVLNVWKKDIGFKGMYRLQYNLWEINEVSQNKESGEKFLANYENIIKQVSDSGGVVILDIFGTPAGMGKALSRKSAPSDLRAFKQLVKDHIRRLSCEKKYNIWYEVWSAPDVDSFFLGRKQEYFSLYRVIAEAVKELRQETKIHIPLGGPGTSWWFQNVEGNSIITPERSLVYDLIRFCYNYRLPLDFITWHAYSTDPEAEKESTRYKKQAIGLIRDWLFYFHFDRNTPLIVDEWNYDSGANVLPERGERSNIAASYIPARMKNMHDAGVNYQLYFCLEDFRCIKENVVRNVGVFWFDPEYSEYKGAAKATYNVFLMLSRLGSAVIAPSAKFNDDFVGAVATKSEDRISLLVYNYIDPDMAKNYLYRGVSELNDAGRKSLINLAKTDKLKKVIRGEIDPRTLRVARKLQAFLKKAQELYEQSVKFSRSDRALKISITNLQGDYLYQRYTVDPLCGSGCEFAPAEEKVVSAAGIYQDNLNLKPYSVSLIVLTPKVKEAPPQEQEPPKLEEKISVEKAAVETGNAAK